MIVKGKGSVLIRTHTNNQKLICFFAHKMPFYQKAFPLYDRQLSKLCHYLHDELQRTINIIDIGANVGDTVLNIGLKDAFYLCIEGNESYAKLIPLNLKKKYHFSVEKYYLTDTISDKRYKFEAINGTGRLLVSNNKQNALSLDTLDHLIELKYKDKYFDLIKIDTDGFDFKIIRGAIQCLRKWHPLLFFEWDKAYCKEQGEDPLSIFPLLNEYGYNECILFDNYGNYIKKILTKDLQQLSFQIEETIGDGLPYYYDVLVIPQNHVITAYNIENLFIN